jgi:hypothetical protein
VSGKPKEENGDGSDELYTLLQTVSDRGLSVLSMEELDKLRLLLNTKDYTNNKKADRSRRKLLKKINAEIFDRHSPRRFL